MCRTTNLFEPGRSLTLLVTVCFAILVPHPECWAQVTLTAKNEPVTGSQPREPEEAVALSEAFRRVAREVGPAVVSVSSTRRVSQTANRRGQDPQSQLPDELRRFFGGGGDGSFDFETPAREREMRGMGSGVVLSADGYILTNNHVAGNADQLDVNFPEGKHYRAKLVGTDKSTDLAVIKIEANNLKPAKLGNSHEAEVGDWVLAIGSPFGLDRTVTAGIISATSRANMGITDYEDFLQTDAAINPGNSGGPLVNLRGEVVGINTAIASRSGGNAGVGFAIPSDMARHVMDSIIKEGHVTRGYLGALIQDLNEDLAKSFGLEVTHGVLIGDVVKGGPAEKAGLRAGDIVTKLDGEPVTNASEFRNAIAATPPGGSVTLEIYRDGKTQTMKAVVDKLDPKNVPGSKGQEESPSEEEATYLGLSVQELTPELAKRLELPGDVQGGVVTAVEPGSPAALLDIAPGDVIVSVGEQQVKSLHQLRTLLDEDHLKKGVRLQILREGVHRYVFLRAE